MSAVSNTPTNKNFLSPLGFKFQIKKAPHVNFFIQEVSIPGISLEAVNYPNPFVNIPIGGDHINFDSLRINFKIDEDLTNYIEIHNWITAIGKPQNFEQFREIEQKPRYSGDGIYSDVSLISTTSSMVPNFEFVFADAHPVSLSGIQFNSTDEDVNYVSATADFKYSYYTISKI